MQTAAVGNTRRFVDKARYFFFDRKRQATTGVEMSPLMSKGRKQCALVSLCFLCKEVLFMYGMGNIVIWREGRMLRAILVGKLQVDFAVRRRAAMPNTLENSMRGQRE
ncbi:transmembrane protein, putative [Bodo saltans]|uniref:Transmembrane protein, putative n=1 Tax=Bodo saltans TaxID=75058 RepID=A0A0S4J442_BODSA|nr:transmembrane protein, putative [Bodo saltans]|eukprot:CUG74651.1 transmembrane protein, putative [Bodo saltans]